MDLQKLQRMEELLDEVYHAFGAVLSDRVGSSEEREDTKQERDEFLSLAREAIAELRKEKG